MSNLHFEAAVPEDGFLKVLPEFRGKAVRISIEELPGPTPNPSHDAKAYRIGTKRNIVPGWNFGRVGSGTDRRPKIRRHNGEI